MKTLCSKKFGSSIVLTFTGQHFPEKNTFRIQNKRFFNSIEFNESDNFTGNDFAIILI